jgi:hypothetical protein
MAPVPQSEQGAHISNNPPQHAIICVVSFGDKVIKTTECSTTNAFSPSDPIRISVNLRSPLESHVTIEVMTHHLLTVLVTLFAAQGQVAIRHWRRELWVDSNPSELVSETSSSPLSSFPDRIEEESELSGWYLLTHKTLHTIGRIHVTLAKEKSSFQPEPLLTMYQFHVPCAVDFSRFPPLLK